MNVGLLQLIQDYEKTEKEIETVLAALGLSLQGKAENRYVSEGVNSQLLDIFTQAMNQADAIDIAKRLAAENQAAPEYAESSHDGEMYHPDYSQSNSVMETALSALVQQTSGDIQALDQLVNDHYVRPAAVATANVILSARPKVAALTAQIVADQLHNDNAATADVVGRVIANFRFPVFAPVPTPQLPTGMAQRAIAGSTVNATVSH